MPRFLSQDSMRRAVQGAISRSGGVSVKRVVYNGVAIRATSPGALTQIKDALSMFGVEFEEHAPTLSILAPYRLNCKNKRSTREGGAWSRRSRPRSNPESISFSMSPELGGGKPKSWPASWPKSLADFYTELFEATWTNPFGGGRIWTGDAGCENGVLLSVVGKPEGWYGGPGVHLDLILTTTPRKGCARRAMTWFTGLAKRHGLWIDLISKPMGRGAVKVPQTALNRFYESFGFVRESTSKHPTMSFNATRSNPAGKWEASVDRNGTKYEAMDIADGLIAVVSPHGNMWNVDIVYRASLWRVRGLSGNDAVLRLYANLDNGEGWEAVRAITEIKGKVRARLAAIEFANSKVFHAEASRKQVEKDEADRKRWNLLGQRTEQAEREVEQGERAGFTWFKKFSHNYRNHEVLVKAPEQLEVARVYYGGSERGLRFIAQAGKHRKSFNDLVVAKAAAIRWVTGGARHNPRSR